MNYVQFRKKRKEKRQLDLGYEIKDWKFTEPCSIAIHNRSFFIHLEKSSVLKSFRIEENSRHKDKIDVIAYTYDDTDKENEITITLFIGEDQVTEEKIQDEDIDLLFTKAKAFIKKCIQDNFDSVIKAQKKNRELVKELKKNGGRGACWLLYNYYCKMPDTSENRYWEFFWLKKLSIYSDAALDDLYLGREKYKIDQHFYKRISILSGWASCSDVHPEDF